jgi:hypothetical protein
MRKLDEPAEHRPFNPFALAGTLIILFSFYISILLNHPERSATYLAASALFMGALWYFCYLSRRETTIEVAKEAYVSKDNDFQVDSANGLMILFSRLVWFLHPIFFAYGLNRAGEASELVYVNAWLDSMKVIVIMTLVYALTCLFIWTRNVREPKLKIAGENNRPDYPEYRDNLAASALPYCIILPALVYAFLNLMGLSPIKIPALEGSIWIDISIYIALTLILIGLFIQLPYRRGAKAWKSPKLERLEEQMEGIKKDIENRRDKLVKSRSSVLAMKTISDELTLNRMTGEIDNEKNSRKLTYNISWPGEIEKDSALYFVISLVASAITTAIATNLDSFTDLLLKIPK